MITGKQAASAIWHTLEAMIGLSGGRMLKVGDVAPDFSVPDHGGKTQRLGDYRGKTVVIWFYPKAGTPG